MGLGQHLGIIAIGVQRIFHYVVAGDVRHGHEQAALEFRQAETLVQLGASEDESRHAGGQILRPLREHAPLASAATPSMGAWSVLASQPAAWKAALIGGKLINFLPTKLLPVPALRAWEHDRTLPKWRGGEFRKWMKNRHRGPAPTPPSPAL